MESRRRTEKNRIFTQLSKLQTYLDRDTASISRLKNSDMGKDYIMHQILKYENSAQRKEDQIKELQERLDLLVRGQLDDELIETEQKVQSVVNAKIEATRREQTRKYQEEVESKQEANDRYQAVGRERRSDGQKRRDMRYGYKQFRKASDTFPDYMQKKLDRMPNNKGYIWRGVRFFGRLDRERGAPTVMFEKGKKDVLIIHETTSTEVRRYEKQGKGKKKLVSRVPRVRKVGFIMGFTNTTQTKAPTLKSEEDFPALG
jgi:hypothetical protein